MGTRYLIDSNAAIDFLGGMLPEKGKQLMLTVKPEISVITVIEIQSKKEIPALEMLKYSAFLRACYVYSDITETITDHTIPIQKQYGLKTPDALIAATAIANGLTLISRNEKDFKKIANLSLINPWHI